VEIVDVVVVGDGDVSTAFPVGVIVSGMLDVPLGGALVEVPLVGGVKVPVVDVVDMVAVWDGHMSAPVTMYMDVIRVHQVGAGHGCSSCECRMASLTM
jgi:hypothetical protein